MIEAYRQLIQQAYKDKKQIRNKVRKLRKKKKGEVDAIFHELHEKAFENIDCLKCANCCASTGPLLTNKDVDRIAKLKQLKPIDFIEQFLRIDEDNDFVFKSMPCTFLGEDHYCTIYSERPKACREYPHTDRVNQLGIMSLTMKNALICPAVAFIFNEID